MRRVLWFVFVLLLVILTPLVASTFINWTRIIGSSLSTSTLACFSTTGAASFCTVDPITLTLSGNVLSAKAQASKPPLVGKTTVSVSTTSLSMPQGCVTPQLLDVYVDGVMLSSTDDYTTTNGTGTTPGTVTFASAVGSGGFTDIVQMRCW